MAQVLNVKSVPSPSELQSLHTLDVAVLIPCYNEELTISKVIDDFRRQLPNATIYVFDNNSTDKTVEIAAKAGAVIRREPRQGKGFVVQSMFRMVEADIYVMVDGDDTYPAKDVADLIMPVLRNDADMVVGSRLHNGSDGGFKTANLLGNYFFLTTLNGIFRVRLTDILSGYRAFSREFVKTVPLAGGGFETEAELTIKSLQAKFRIAEVPVNLGTRPEGSFSKIRRFRDGMRILMTIFSLFRDYKPLAFFGGLAVAFVACGLIPGGVVMFEYFRTGLVLHMPSAVLAVGLTLVGIISLVAGVILDAITRRIRELEHLIRCVASRDDMRLSKSAQRKAA
jgi:glycosyltransferase involved in cell wall biosynthesis